MDFFSYLREFNMPSVLLRLTLAVVFGGIIGSNREHKRQPAGFRTYMIKCWRQFGRRLSGRWA